MTLFSRFAAMSVALFITACETTPPPPPPITAAEFASYKLTEIVVNTDDAEVVWPAAERDFAKREGVEAPRQTNFGNPDDEPDDSADVQFAAYEATTTSDAAVAYYRAQVQDVVAPLMEEAMAPAFTGAKPLRMTVDVDTFQIRSSGAVALGGAEGMRGTVSFAEVEGNTPVATSAPLQYISPNGQVGYGGGSLAGLAIGLAVTAAINVASDAVIDSDRNITKNFANTTRGWLQLEPYVYPEDRGE